MQEISNQEITAMELPRRKKNYVLWRIGTAKRNGTNFILLPSKKVDAETINYLRGRNYKMYWMPLRREVLIEWDYKRSPHRAVRTSNTQVTRVYKHLNYSR